METVRVPEPVLLIPAPICAALPEIVELVMVRLPELLKAPPLPDLLAPVTVTPEMARLPAISILKILKLPWLASINSEELLGPLIVSEPAPDAAAIAGKAVPRVIVLTPFKNIEDEKIISSLAVVALASIIACLREPAPESALVVTMKWEDTDKDVKQTKIYIT